MRLGLAVNGEAELYRPDSEQKDLCTRVECQMTVAIGRLRMSGYGGRSG